MSAMAFVSITPLGEGESVSKFVAKSVQVIKDSGLSWQLTPMGTVIEGEKLDEVFAVINRAVEAQDECERISISVKIDYRKNKSLGLNTKVDSVMNKLK
ncbi:MTH1187 family thiamine-binding protein [Seleniivibrio sp.]|uniref:MTH1187 family thiamine-binding protein n=1 Tax=Seleniivibrio sp. TaxID=2898801 RepID=UPI0025CE64E9|nr:MTH1187 family thiamine-binding protein [Seleniivibrio sp.]MCD8554787.1 MTH1187 family thiamine-binding protein [Seleniivibrio sp.]